jgi:hypothetical protein
MKTWRLTELSPSCMEKIDHTRTCSCMAEDHLLIWSAFWYTITKVTPYKKETVYTLSSTFVIFSMQIIYSHEFDPTTFTARSPELILCTVSELAHLDHSCLHNLRTFSNIHQHSKYCSNSTKN